MAVSEADAGSDFADASSSEFAANSVLGDSPSGTPTAAAAAVGLPNEAGGTSRMDCKADTRPTAEMGGAIATAPGSRSPARRRDQRVTS